MREMPESTIRLLRLKAPRVDVGVDCPVTTVNPDVLLIFHVYGWAQLALLPSGSTATNEESINPVGPGGCDNRRIVAIFGLTVLGLGPCR